MQLCSNALIRLACNLVQLSQRTHSTFNLALPNNSLHTSGTLRGALLDYGIQIINLVTQQLTSSFIPLLQHLSLIKQHWQTFFQFCLLLQQLRNTKFFLRCFNSLLQSALTLGVLLIRIRHNLPRLISRYRLALTINRDTHLASLAELIKVCRSLVCALGCRALQPSPTLRCTAQLSIQRCPRLKPQLCVHQLVSKTVERCLRLKAARLIIATKNTLHKGAVVNQLNFVSGVCRATRARLLVAVTSWHNNSHSIVIKRHVAVNESSGDNDATPLVEEHCTTQHLVHQLTTNNVAVLWCQGVSNANQVVLQCVQLASHNIQRNRTTISVQCAQIIQTLD